MNKNINLTCKKCRALFRPFIYIDGIRIPGYNRKYCWVCNPHNSYSCQVGNTSNRNTDDGKRQCLICEKFYPLECFSRTNKEGNLNSYCKKCSANKKQKSSQRFKLECVAYKGGKCERCGYDKCPAAFDFHHKDPTKKDFKISASKTTITEAVKIELDKCELLCANCHREEHFNTIH